jgi:hypothetical protein
MPPITMSYASIRECYAIGSLQIRNLAQYLNFQLLDQQVPLLMELEGDEFMEWYLRNYKGKPFFVRKAIRGNELEAT